MSTFRGLTASSSFLVLSLVVGCGADEGKTSSLAAAPTVAEAADFVAEYETTMAEFGEYSARIAWAQATNITYDTNWLLSTVSAEGTEMGVAFANRAKRFNELELPTDLRRKIEMIKLGLNVPAPSSVGSADELAQVETRMQSQYSTGFAEIDGVPISGNDLEAMMGTVRDADRLQEMWTMWREITIAPYNDGSAGNMKQDYARMIEIANAGAKELGFADLGTMWRARYDMPPAEFAAETDRLWGQVEPLYKQLHCHVRAELNAVYGDGAVPLDQPIRADLLGNMWAQSWGNIYDLVAPEDADPGYDVTQLLLDNGYTALKMVETGEAFFSSLGFDPLPKTFYERSQITRPEGRDVVCHASAWNLDSKDDIRIKMCTKVNADDFQTVHHELGHNYYQRAYKNKSPIYQTGANGGFHEAIGDMIALSITPDYLRQIGLLDEVPDASKDVGLLMGQALEKVAFMPFGLLVDKWRWQAFSGELTQDTYNDGWWALRTEYQGIRPPVARDARYFDPGAKYHVPNNVSYTRYFIAHILQFQFHKAACEKAGWTGPLHRCSIYGSRDVGEAFNAMLEMGAEKPWPEALEAFTGSRQMDGSAVVEYFAPLMTWLEDQNKDRQCGW